jgi:uncharacterized NAD(P)/FAD-binding protein YdhS
MSMGTALSTIAIVGGGASGSLVATQLLRQARQPVRILLFERMTDIAQGVAYGTRCPEHLLNVPAGRMGAFPDQVDHFLRWVERRAGQAGFPAAVAPGDFLPRGLYGEYLREVLTEARAAAVAGVEFEIIKGEVLDIEGDAPDLRLRLGGGSCHQASRVVLAIGNLPGEYPIQEELPIYHSQRYVHVPWRPGVLSGIGADEDVLLVGAGLTAIDLTLELNANGHRGTVHALSRRGLLPQAHRAAPAYPDFLAGETLPVTVRGIFRRLRREIRAAQEQGLDWRPVLDAIRSRSQALWQGLSWTERARFMRHLRPFWEVHRHRIAPPVAARIEQLREQGRLRFHAGRLSELREVAQGVEARFRPRGTAEMKIIRVAKVINCTGPRSDYSKYQHPLLRNLLAHGLIDHDPLALGIRATPEGEILRYRGEKVGWLDTIGVPLKGDLWECTAMPEIRVQAQRMASRLLASVHA